jgi:hypothetical protein
MIDAPPFSGDLSALHQEAELHIKRVELECGDVAIPAINQLRYAGHHIISLNLQSDVECGDICPSCGHTDTKKEAEARAKRHIQRAIFDASEIGVNFCLREIHRFDLDYRTTEVSTIIENITQIRIDTVEAQDIRGDARVFCRRTLYQNLIQSNTIFQK